MIIDMNNRINFLKISKFPIGVSVIEMDKKYGEKLEMRCQNQKITIISAVPQKNSNCFELLCHKPRAMELA